MNQREVRNIDRSDQQHQRYCDKQRDQRWAYVAVKKVVDSNDIEIEVPTIEPRFHRLGINARLIQRHIILQTSQAAEEVRAAPCWRLKLCCAPDVCFTVGEGEVRRCYANDCCTYAVQVYCATDYLRIRVEACPPETVAD